MPQGISQEDQGLPQLPLQYTLVERGCSPPWEKWVLTRAPCSGVGFCLGRGRPWDTGRSSSAERPEQRTPCLRVLSNTTAGLRKCRVWEL